MSEQIKRYDPAEVLTDRWEMGSMDEKADGDYVEFDERSRIVAAKDAEIAQLSAVIDNKTYNAEAQDRTIRAMAAELEQLRAQPARQVGGDEREQFEAWLSSLKFVAGQGQEHVAYCLHRDLSDSYTVEWVRDMWRGWQARAALAPAAVVEALSNDEIHQIAFELGGTNDGEYLLTADDLDALVARLNRNAISGGLLERCLEQMESDWRQIDGEWGPTKGGLEGAVANGHAEEIRELRALLGKEGEW